MAVWRSVVPDWWRAEAEGGNNSRGFLKFDNNNSNNSNNTDYNNNNTNNNNNTDNNNSNNNSNSNVLKIFKLRHFSSSYSILNYDTFQVHIQY